MHSIVYADPVEVWSGGDGLTFNHSFVFEHTEEAHERFIPAEDGDLTPGMGKYIQLSSLPYPYTQPLSYDQRNRTSTLPIDISAVLKETSSAENCYLYLHFIDSNDYPHRSLTIQEVDPSNPDDPNNSNPIYDIRTLPFEYDMYKYDAGTFQQNVERMFRVGAYRKLDGDLTENGAVDFNDFAVFGNYWLDETAEGENLNISDIDHDRLTDELDLFYFVDTWLKEE